MRRGAGEREHRQVRDLPDLLAPGDLVVVNETRVLPARLHGTVAGTARPFEVLLVREIAPGRWRGWVRHVRRLRSGEVIGFAGHPTQLKFLGRDGEEAELEVLGDISLLLAGRGEVPLPPYIRRPLTASDRDDYQTVFARVPGAVAAPTAGLHFTEDLLSRLAVRGIELERLVLHVGPGTFRPIRTGDILEHKVQSEYYAIPGAVRSAVARCRARGSRVVAVGTTTVRALETWGLHGPGADEAIAEGAEGWTDLTIVPPFEFRVVDALLTNFHLPRSSLLLLVSAFAGTEALLAAYEEAIRREYRFYSYGDAMVIL
jgi:S-adenosylmethionine:tRNA ribosyltransferase-isomerase